MFSTTSLKKMNKPGSWPRGQNAKVRPRGQNAKVRSRGQNPKVWSRDQNAKVWPRGQNVQPPSRSRTYLGMSNITEPDVLKEFYNNFSVATDNNNKMAAGGGQIPKEEMTRECNVCKKARELCKEHKYCGDCSYEHPWFLNEECDDYCHYYNCNYCNNEEIHHLLKSNSNKKCICDRKGLELLLDKNKVIAERYRNVLSLYLIRKNYEKNNRHNKEKYRYGFLEPNFIWGMFREYTEGVKEEIPEDYITDWPWKWFDNKEDEREMWEEEQRRWECGCERCNPDFWRM